MVKFVDDELKRILDEVLSMWTLVYEQMENACDAIPTSDKEKAMEVLIREKRVNASELKLDCDIEDFLALYNPVAIDLRFALAMMKTITDLERIGDFAENIARFVIRQEGKQIDPQLLENLRLKDMVAGVLDMLQTAKEALVKEDIALANSLFEKDNLIDELNLAANKVLADYAQAHADAFALCMDLKGVYIRLERTGDHVTNLAEEIVFYVDAEVLKHSTNNKTMPALNNRMKENAN